MEPADLSAVDTQAPGDPQPATAPARAGASPVDQALWDRLIRDHDRAVVLSLVALGIERERARDLAQTTWLKLMDQHRRGRLAELRLPGLAITQARFLALDELRRTGLERRLPRPTRESTEGFVHLRSRDQLRRALAALATCPPVAQRVFEMLYGRQPPLGYAEVATEVGLSPERVRHIVCEVRRAVRVAIDEEPS